MNGGEKLGSMEVWKLEVGKFESSEKRKKNNQDWISGI